MRVVLEEAETELDEVVVTGMFSRKKEGFTGSAVTVKGDELKKISTTSIAKALSTLNPVSGSWKISVRVRSEPFTGHAYAWFFHAACRRGRRQ